MPLSLRSLLRRLLPSKLLPEISIHGTHSQDWMDSLRSDAPVWTLLRKSRHAQPASGDVPRWRKRVVVPLMERHILSLPTGCHALVPDAQSMAILADKARFARYAEDVGLAHLLPRSLDVNTPSFPSALKRTNLRAGKGVAIVTSIQDLEARLGCSPWADGKVILQEHVAGRTDRVTHLVCVNGRIVWHQSYTFRMKDARRIRGPVGSLAITRCKTRASDFADFERLLVPLGFDGPANVDYRHRPDGRLAIFEINPRLGGSLMRPENAHDLAGALRSIVRHAKWRPHPAPTDAATPVRHLAANRQ